MIRAIKSLILRRQRNRDVEAYEAARLDALTDHGFLDRAVGPSAQDLHIKATTKLLMRVRNETLAGMQGIAPKVK